MKKYILLSILAALLLITPALTTRAFVPPSFGGRVVMIQPCNTGLLVWVFTPHATVEPFMWFVGNLPFLSYIPPMIGQQLLGWAGPAMVPCILGPVEIGEGYPIIFHGSSPK